MSDRLEEIEARLDRLATMKKRARDRHDADLRDLLAVAKAIEAELTYKYTSYQRQVHFPQTTTALAKLKEGT